MKHIVDVDESVFTRLSDNGVNTSSEDREIIDRAVRTGEPYEERPQGEWKCTFHSSFPQYEPDEYKCSICGCKGYKPDKFCRHCGADMRGGRE